MFERYTEKARRVIFFGRYEAAQFGSEYIETEHLLLGLLREDRALAFRLLRAGSMEAVREQVCNRSTNRPARSTSVDLPLSNECKRILAYAADEAERLQHKHIGTEHLLLGILREKKSVAAEILRDQGLDLENARLQVRDFQKHDAQDRSRFTVHGIFMPPHTIVQSVKDCKRFAWQKRMFAPSDIVIRRSDHLISFDLALAESEFDLIKDGWTEDVCRICSWSLAVSDEPERGTGYTNGRFWLCSECYEKFVSAADDPTTS